jgi:hypothetical protein
LDKNSRAVLVFGLEYQEPDFRMSVAQVLGAWVRLIAAEASVLTADIDE